MIQPSKFSKFGQLFLDFDAAGRLRDMLAKATEISIRAAVEETMNSRLFKEVQILYILCDPIE